jgi:dihydroorotate dehydrogenase (NAD+) catalytic subunit
MLNTPFYDPEKSYEDNYKEGPFGAFADGKIIKTERGPQYDFFGYKIYSPFGIPAGPLINGNFMKAAFENGFDICVYKTVRTRAKKCNEWPNVLPVDVKGDLTIEKARQGLVTKKEFTEPLAITNSFGNPSYDPKIWQADIMELMKWANERKGQVVCGMIEGTRWEENFTEQDFLNDWVLAARLMNETRIQVIEANFSCPNEGDKVGRLLCFDTVQSQRIAEAIKKEIGNTPLVIKIPYFESEVELRNMVKKLGNVVDGFSAINTIPSVVHDEKGNQALPGGVWRLKSGVCGAPIKWAGLEMVKRLKELREEFNYSYTIIGVGGVSTPEDFMEYRNAGADVVMSATGAMWNPYLAQEIKKNLNLKTI